MGSPPRVRGTDNANTWGATNSGITPARAGNSRFRIPARCPLQDHPRACGEQSVKPTPTPSAMGSPPRVRGTVTMSALVLFRFGITPARAGNSLVRDAYA